MESFARVKRTFFARKECQLLRIQGAYLSAHENEISDKIWDADLRGCTVSSVWPNSSFTILMRYGSPVYLTVDKEGPRVCEWIAALKNASHNDFDLDYALGEKIAEGPVAVWRKATEKISGRDAVVKIIKKEHVDSCSAAQIDRELFACASVRASGVVPVRGIYQTQHTAHIVMDLMEGGNLKDMVQSAGGVLSELVVAKIVRTALTSLKVLHKAGLVHMNLSLENILCVTASLPIETVISDFGCVQSVTPGAETIQGPVKTSAYSAPEISLGLSYGAQVDVWAVGSMAFEMLSGGQPFAFDNNGGESTANIIISNRVNFHGMVWERVSPNCKSLLRGLLDKNPDSRLTAQGALEHEWLETPTQRAARMNYTIGERDPFLESWISNPCLNTSEGLPQPTLPRSLARTNSGKYQTLGAVVTASSEDQSQLLEVPVPDSGLDEDNYYKRLLPPRKRFMRADHSVDAIFLPCCNSSADITTPVKVQSSAASVQAPLPEKVIIENEQEAPPSVRADGTNDENFERHGTVPVSFNSEDYWGTSRSARWRRSFFAGLLHIKMGTWRTPGNQSSCFGRRSSRTRPVD